MHSLRNPYCTRTAVQLLWAAIVIATAVSNPALAASFLVLYPLWDVACTLYDLKSSAHPGPPNPRYVNVVLGSIVAISIAFTAFKSPQQAVVTFGVWAFAAGLAQPAEASRAENNWARSEQ